MSGPGEVLACPACTTELQSAGDDLLSCPRCLRVHGRVGTLRDLRVTRRPTPAPEPLDVEAVARALKKLRRGEPWRGVLEELLLELPDAAADRTMQLLREARGAWFPLLRTDGGTALVLGNALSGTAIPLLNHGFDVTLVDLSPERLELALFHKRALGTGGETRALLAGDGVALPFEDASFDLVVHEEGLPDHAFGWGHDVRECQRVCRGELFATVANRFAYKRSSGLRGDFVVPGPLEFLRRGLSRDTGERTLRGYRRALASPDFERARAFAVYPDAREFTFVVGLDGTGPRLAVGPKERKNRVKILGSKLGLFPVFTPSFAVTASRSTVRTAPRIERVLDELAERTGEPRPEVDQWIATRGNAALIQTRPPAGADLGSAGSWSIHLALSPAEGGQLVRHFEVLQRLGAEFPDVPAPTPLFAGTLAGIFLTCERRLPGLTAPQLTGDARAAARIYADCARFLARLVTVAAAPFDEDAFERLVGSRFDLVARFAREPRTVANLSRMRAEARERLVGRPMPRVLHHADLRSKHVQVRPEGRVIGFLDWGCAEDDDLPYFDLLHLVAHERKQEALTTGAEAWRIVRERELREHEASALDDYARAVGIDDAARRALETIYPVLVAGMAERNWDYSRPRWVARQFGL